MTHRLADDLVLDDEGRHRGRGRAAVGARRARRRRSRRPRTSRSSARTARTAITLRHLLTHTAGHPQRRRRSSTGTPWRESRAENLARIYAAPLEYEPGTRAGYHPAAGMSVLGEIVARVSGVPYEQYVRDEIFGPLGMADCWVGMPARSVRGVRRPHRLHARDRRRATPERVARASTPPGALAEPMPGANGRGPMNQLGRFYEMLLGHGRARRRAAALAGHRRRDLGAPSHRRCSTRRFGVVIDWGLGLVVDWYATGRLLLAARVRSRRSSVVGRVLRSRARSRGRGRVQRHARPRAPQRAPRRDQQRGLRRRSGSRAPDDPGRSQAVPDARALIARSNPRATAGRPRRTLAAVRPELPAHRSLCTQGAPCPVLPRSESYAPAVGCRNRSRKRSAPTRCARSPTASRSSRA